MFNKIFYLLRLMFTVFLFYFTNLDAREKIVIAADEWPPFNCTAGSDSPGYMIEIAEIIFSEAGYDFEYITLPWSRALLMCQDGKIEGVVGAAKREGRRLIYPAEELGRVDNAAFTLRKSSWTFRNTQDLYGKRIGVIFKYYYGEELMKYIEAFKNTPYVQVVCGEDALQKNIRKLMSGRIDVIIEAEPVFNYTVKRMGIADRFRFAGSDRIVDNLYIAFSPNEEKTAVSLKYAAILDEGIRRLRKNGRLKVILDKYGVKDWKEAPAAEP